MIHPRTARLSWARHVRYFDETQFRRETPSARLTHRASRVPFRARSPPRRRARALWSLPSTSRWRRAKLVFPRQVCWRGGTGSSERVRAAGPRTDKPEVRRTVRRQDYFSSRRSAHAARLQRLSRRQSLRGRINPPAHYFACHCLIHLSQSTATPEFIHDQKSCDVTGATTGTEP